MVLQPAVNSTKVERHCHNSYDVAADEDSKHSAALEVHLSLSYSCHRPSAVDIAVVEVAFDGNCRCYC